jgi:hypothetical protein
MLIDSSKKKNIAKRESGIFSGRKEKTRNVQLRYIEDMYVMVVFFAC